MKTLTVHLSEIKLNDRNPRVIKDTKFDKLVDSILVFPKMLTYRSILVDENRVILGGNMRYKALAFIATLDGDAIKARICTQHDFMKYSAKEQTEVLNFWSLWREQQTIEVGVAEGLTEYQKKQLIIKDNVAYGEWDWEAFNFDDGWELDDLAEWGIDVSFLSQSDVDIDSLFEDANNHEAKSKDLKIEILVSPDQEGMLSAIKDSIKAALTEYNGITIR